MRNKIVLSSYIIFSLAIFGVFFDGPQSASAVSSLGNVDTTAIVVRPSNPRPYQAIELSIENYSISVDSAMITWFINGTIARQGKGERTLSTTLAGPGSPFQVSVILKDTSGTILTKSLNFSPQNVDILYDVDSYTPPFYKGKALYPYQGLVRVVALADFIDGAGNPISPNNLIYEWWQNNKKSGPGSGYGKKLFAFQGGVLMDGTTIKVRVTTEDGVNVAENSIFIEPQTPEVGLYENSPLYGIIRNKELGGGYSLSGNEIKITAIPYFYSTKKATNPSMMTYSWSINNEPIPSAKNKTEAVFRRVSNGSGNAVISLETTQPTKIYQFSTTDMTLSFSENN